MGEGLIEGRVHALQDIKSFHHDFINELSSLVEHYWFDHHYWKRELTNILRIKRFLNSVSKSLDITLSDPFKPSPTRCSECNKLVSVKKNKYSCSGAQLAIPLLSSKFKVDCKFIPDELNKSLTDYPSHITSERIRHLCTILECYKLNQEAQKWGALESRQI